ncbi:hypothetical protein GWI33_018943 [Rhynchophorus ferrugineus]|uniref:Uncharacterized protein n=1 Tax=Rhynchophorus ferrugineus TaxID=354439 RepID=A0A834HWV9_RHYFE|nr:hypothetical protein GWI33_018943 [Rhynchophorus ferrugineus]
MHCRMSDRLPIIGSFSFGRHTGRPKIASDPPLRLPQVAANGPGLPRNRRAGSPVADVDSFIIDVMHPLKERSTEIRQINLCSLLRTPAGPYGSHSMRPSCRRRRTGRRGRRVERGTGAVFGGNLFERARAAKW